MIKNFGDGAARDIYDGENSRHARKIPHELHGKIARLLDQINAAPTIDMLKVPPGNRLEKLHGNLSEFWSIRINDQWRIIFKWEDGNALETTVVDYH